MNVKPIIWFMPLLAMGVLRALNPPTAQAADEEALIAVIKLSKMSDPRGQ